jgi:hypothetical protein
MTKACTAPETGSTAEAEEEGRGNDSDAPGGMGRTLGVKETENDTAGTGLKQRRGKRQRRVPD